MSILTISAMNSPALLADSNSRIAQAAAIANVANVTVSEVVDSANASTNATKGLYVGSDNKYYIDTNGLFSGGSISQSAIALTSKGKTWSSGKAEVLGLRTTAAGFEVIMRQGEGAKATYSVQSFDATGLASGKTEKLNTVGMLSAEVTYDQDFSGDTAKGDVVASVIDATDDGGVVTDIGLYKLASNRYVIDTENKSVNASTTGGVVYLTNKGKNWDPGKSEAIAVRKTLSGFEVMLQTGTGDKTKYSVQAFDANGALTGKATSLTAATLTFAESEFKQEFNDDNVRGDYVTEVLDAEDVTGTVGLYKLKSGYVAAGNDNLAVGASSSGMTEFSNKGKLWTSKTQPIAIAKTASGGYTVIVKSGLEEKSKLTEATFDATGSVAAKTVAIKFVDIKTIERTYDQDFNDDEKVGNSAFNIKVNFTGDASYQPYFEASAARWSEIILNDLSDATNQSYNWSNVSGYETLGSKTYGTIDDLLIEAVMYDGGDNGNLGSAGPIRARDDGMPIIGRMRFNTYYMSGMISSNTFGDVILHEMGHILGLGTRWSSLKDGSGNYTGEKALAQYSALMGTTQTSVPVETSGGAGTAGAHWAENVFDEELMTGWAENSPPMPLSRITVGSLEDLGYTVSYTMADAFTLSLSAGNQTMHNVANGIGHQFHLWEDMHNETIGLTGNTITINIKA
jgi:NAD/NADP transhydrogenase alpha subunit